METSMNCPDEEEDLHQRHIAEEILSSPAEHILSYEKVKDPLSLLLNMAGALRNWEDVAALLGYRPERIRGDFAHRTYPGLTLLEDWMYKRKGLLGRLVEVFIELEFLSCMDVVHDCVAEYEAGAGTNSQNPSESDDSDDFQASAQGRYETDIDTSMSTASSPRSASCTMETSTYPTNIEMSLNSSEYSTTPSLTPPEINHAWADSGSFSVTNQENCTISCEDLGHREEQCKGETLSKPSFLRNRSWSPTETGSLDKEPNLLHLGGEPNLTRSFSQPNDMKSKAGFDSKRKSFRKRLGRFFRKNKQHKKSPAHSSEKVDLTSPVMTATSTADPTKSAAFSVDGTYREAAEKRCENLSPLKVEEARRSSDSLSSGESMSNPTSPGYESGYMSSEGPSVSSGKSISIIHCFDLEDEVLRTAVLKLHRHFSEELGYKCHLDKLEMMKIAENKFRYAAGRVRHSDFVFICVSPQLKRIFDSSVDEISEQLEDDGNCMLRLVSDLILSELANNGSNRKGKFMTILLEGSSKSDVPCFLESFMVYRWPKEERKIRCIIEEKPEIMPAPVCCVKTDPPSQVVTPANLV